MSQPTIRVEGLGKLYRIGSRGPHSSLREAIGLLMAAPRRAVRLFGVRPLDGDDVLWALRDVEFEVARGEVVGVIGRNGAGKSTLLKVLSRITEPTEGRVELAGRVGTLLEVGTGFHPELSGRENIFFNGAVLGMRRREIERRFDEIVAFAEVDRFLDTPVKRYSSGMYVRLAFAVAAHLEAEILLVDEVLAVGDIGFQRKCLGKMGEVAGSGRTVLFVSHNLGAVRDLCSRGLLFEEGRLRADGPVAEVARTYYEGVQERTSRVARFPEDPAKRICITEIAVIGGEVDGGEVMDFRTDLEVTVRYRVACEVRGASIALIVSREGVPVFMSFEIETQPHLYELRTSGEYMTRARLPSRLLKAGLYSLTVEAGRIGLDLLDCKQDAVSFELIEMSEDTTAKGYSASRRGVVIADVDWLTSRS